MCICVCMTPACDMRMHMCVEMLLIPVVLTPGQHNSSLWKHMSMNCLCIFGLILFLALCGMFYFLWACYASVILFLGCMLQYCLILKRQYILWNPWRLFAFHFSTPTQTQNRYSILGWGYYRWPTRSFLNSKGENVGICKAMKGVSTFTCLLSL